MLSDSGAVTSGEPAPRPSYAMRSGASAPRDYVPSGTLGVLTSTTKDPQERYAGKQNDRADPFVWTKTAEEILEKANRQTTSHKSH